MSNFELYRNKLLQNYLATVLSQREDMVVPNDESSEQEMTTPHDTKVKATTSEASVGVISPSPSINRAIQLEDIQLSPQIHPLPDGNNAADEINNSS